MQVGSPPASCRPSPDFQDLYLNARPSWPQDLSIARFAALVRTLQVTAGLHWASPGLPPARPDFQDLYLNARPLWPQGLSIARFAALVRTLQVTAGLHWASPGLPPARPDFQ